MYYISCSVELLCILRHTPATNLRSHLIQYSSNNSVVASNSHFVHFQKLDIVTDIVCRHKLFSDWIEHILVLQQCACALHIIVFGGRQIDATILHRLESDQTILYIFWVFINSASITFIGYIFGPP